MKTKLKKVGMDLRKADFTPQGIKYVLQQKTWTL